MKSQPRNPFLAAMKPNPLNHFRSARAGALASFILLPMALPVSAADSIWTGATDLNWATGTNWSAGVPGAAEMATFNGSTALTPRIAGNTTIGTLVFDNTNTTTISSASGSTAGNRKTLTIGSGGITMASTAGSVNLSTGIRSMNVTLEASQTWLNNNSASTLTMAIGSNSGKAPNTLDLGANTLTVDGAGATTISSANITGSAATAFIKNGAGVLTFNSAGASFSGDVQINAGTVRYGVASALPSTADVIFNTTSGTATMDLNGLSGTIASLKIDGATGTNAAITTGAGTLTLGGGILYNDGITGTSNGATISGKLDLGAASRDFNIRDSGVDVELLVDAVISGTGVGLTKINNGALTLNGLNTFTGAVILREGVNSVNTLKDVGEASSLGTGADASVVQLGYGNRTGLLRYTGATTSTNRQIQLGRTNATEIGGGVIENNGSGALTFSNTVAGFNAALAGVTATRNLSLRGTNTDLNTISGIIRDNDTGTGGLVQLTKEDAGTWVLAGANTYTGATNVNGGTLLINGSTSTSLVTVASGATLGGSGIVGGNTTISGIHSPGTSPGIQTFSNNLSYTTNSSVTWELVSDGIGTRGTDFDGINVGGTLDFTGSTSLNLVFNFAGSTVNWADTFWDTSHTGTSGWLVYDGATSLTNFGNLSVTAANWLDGTGPIGLFNSSRSGNTFTVFQDGNDIYLNYNVVPEPRAALLGGLGLLCLLRRRRA